MPRTRTVEERVTEYRKNSKNGAKLLIEEMEEIQNIYRTSPFKAIQFAFHLGCLKTTSKIKRMQRGGAK